MIIRGECVVAIETECFDYNPVMRLGNDLLTNQIRLFITIILWLLKSRHRRCLQCESDRFCSSPFQ